MHQNLTSATYILRRIKARARGSRDLVPARTGPDQRSADFHRHQRGDFQEMARHRFVQLAWPPVCTKRLFHWYVCIRSLAHGRAMLCL